MTTLNKTLDTAGVMVALNDKHPQHPQNWEDIVDAVAALETAGGDITSVVAGAGMTGGGSSGEVTLNVIGGTNITVNANDVQLSTNVDVAGTLDVTGVLTLDDALNHDGTTVGFYGTAPITKQTGVAVTAEAIHAALVALGLIAA